MSRIFWFITICLLFLLPVHAQESTCTDGVDSTVANCSDFESDSACLGAGQVTAVQDCVAPADFNVSGDVIGLEGVCSMHVGTRLSPDEWGLAVLRLAVDESDAFVTMVLSGDVDIQNAASVRETLALHIVEDTVAYGGPGMQFEEMVSLTAGDAVSVEACNCTGNWVRLLLDDGRSGWIPARFIEEQDALENLPTRDIDSPVYDTMQAFRLSTWTDETGCVKDGVLIQSPETESPYPMEINGVQMWLEGATLFVQETQAHDLTLLVLSGVVSVDINDTAVRLAGGMTAVVASADDMQSLSVMPLTLAETDGIPLAVLPQEIDLEAVLNNPVPQIISIPDCRVQSDNDDSACELEFVNMDGDEIVQINVEFVDAAEGDWTGSEHETANITTGDNMSGTIAIPQSCSVGSSSVIIGPVEWSVTIEDADGNLSEPFTAYSFCVVE